MNLSRSNSILILVVLLVAGCRAPLSPSPTKTPTLTYVQHTVKSIVNGEMIEVKLPDSLTIWGFDSADIPGTSPHEIPVRVIEDTEFSRCPVGIVDGLADFVLGDKVVVEGRWEGETFAANSVQPLFYYGEGKVITREGDQIETTSGTFWLDENVRVFTANGEETTAEGLQVDDSFFGNYCDDPESGNQILVGLNINPTLTPQPTQTLVATIVPTSPSQPTSTPDKSYEIPGSAFCQLAPTVAYPGLSVNVTAYKFPANHPVSVWVDLQEVAISTTDDNGYVNLDIVIPPIDSAGWASVYVMARGTGLDPGCLIWLETEENPDPTPTKTPTPTLSPDEIAVTATQQVLHDQLGEHCGTGRPALRIRLSPDGQWAVLECKSEAIALVRMDELKVWRLSSESLIDPYSEFFINLARWSKDGAYAYVVADPHTDGFWEPFHQGAVLYRIRLETGQINEVLPKGTDGYIFYAYTFSPDDNTLAYIVTDESPVVLTLRDLQTGNEQKITFESKYNTGGGYIWSPDGHKFVFSVAQYDTTITNHDYVAVSIYMWDQENKEMKLLVEDYPEFLEPHKWVEEPKIILHAVIEEQGKIETITLELDLASNEIKQIDP